ncbi:MAG: hypothetical protein ABIY71_12705 [Flavobacteriales bacterium]
MFNGARILVAPLDWGLGHAARCVPVIRELLVQGAVPVIGADWGPLAMLRVEFPELEYVRMPGMEVRYAEGRSQAWAMAKQLPAMLRQVRTEHHFLQAHRRELQLDAVISDQRFGIRAVDLPSVLITHQLFPFSPFAQGPARRLNKKHILRFDRCWVPDREAAPGLSGALSHGKDLPRNARFIGPLSRFVRVSGPAPKMNHRVVAVISGPEPQRAMLEKQVLAQLLSIEGPHLLLTGKPGMGSQHHGQVHVTGHLPTVELQDALMHAELIVARTGYSTLMDLDALERGALLIPTPGQPEQEYLGQLHMETGIHQIQEQHGLNIALALSHLPSFIPPALDDPGLSSAMTELAHLLSARRSAPYFRS